MSRPASPYLVPGFYDEALARGRHRDIVGGRWDETGRLQLALLQSQGLAPHHHLLDIGAGSLRLGCKVVPYLDPGHYWATDASRALMLRGHATELSAPDLLPVAQLVEDATFAFPGVPDRITHAIAWGVFTHLPAEALTGALASVRARFPQLERLLLTVFLAAEAEVNERVAQPDGVVTHPERPPYHVTEGWVRQTANDAGFTATLLPDRLPRGQRLWVLCPDAVSAVRAAH